MSLMTDYVKRLKKNRENAENLLSRFVLGRSKSSKEKLLSRLKPPDTPPVEVEEKTPAPSVELEEKTP